MATILIHCVTDIKAKVVTPNERLGLIVPANPPLSYPGYHIRSKGRIAQRGASPLIIAA